MSCADRGTMKSRPDSKNKTKTLLPLNGTLLSETLRRRTRRHKDTGSGIRDTLTRFFAERLANASGHSADTRRNREYRARPDELGSPDCSRSTTTPAPMVAGTSESKRYPLTRVCSERRVRTRCGYKVASVKTERRPFLPRNGEPYRWCDRLVRRRPCRWRCS